MSTHKGNLPKFLVKKFGEETVRNLVAPDAKILAASALKRANRNPERKQRVIETLLLIQKSGDSRFLSRDAAKLSGIELNSFSKILMFTHGVKFAGHGVWELTGEPLAVES